MNIKKINQRISPKSIQQEQHKSVFPLLLYDYFFLNFYYLINIDFTYLFFSAGILSLVAFGDILFKYNGSNKLKWAFLILMLSNTGAAFINFLPEKTIGTLLLQIFFNICMATAILNILIFFHFSKKFKLVNLLPVIWLILFMITLFTNLNTLPNTLENTDNAKFFTRPFYKELSASSLTSVLRMSSFLVFLVICFYLSFQLIQRYKNYNNQFSRSLRNWVFLIVFTVFLIIIQNVFFIIQINKSLDTIISLIIPHWVALVFLYRPAFINRTYFKKSIFEIPKEESQLSEVNEELFINEFYHKAYFTNPDASLKGFAELVDVAQNDLFRFINNKFSCSFNDLVQQRRIELYLELVSKRENQNFTIEALAKEVGFASRTTFYVAFKKFHGGMPSDII